MGSSLLSFVEAAVTVALGVGSVWFSRRASKLSEPTAHGFTDHVLLTLDSHTRQLLRIEKRLAQFEGFGGPGPGPESGIQPGGCQPDDGDSAL